jgi:alpha-aminoadipate/glutamate carrier protein LysW
MWSGPAQRFGLANAEIYRITVISGGIFMVECPVCDGKIDVDEEDVDEGDTISCDECGAALKVIGTAPLELESAEEVEEDEEDEEGLVEDEEEEADEDWK